MGHIELATPVSHIWYVKGVPSYIGLTLDMSPRDLEEVIYFVSYVVLDPGATTLIKKQTLSDKEYRAYYEKYGARPIKRFVQRNVETLIANAIINDKIKFGSTITIDFQDNKLILK